jgi:hypothetical protein
VQILPVIQGRIYQDFPNHARLALRICTTSILLEEKRAPYPNVSVKHLLQEPLVAFYPAFCFSLPPLC